MRADKEESLRNIAADVETDLVTAKVTCFYNYDDHYAPFRTTLVEIHDLLVDAQWHPSVGRRDPRGLYTSHPGNCTDVEFHARRTAIVRAPARR